MAARVVIAGGGVAALEAALALQALAPGQADVELVAPEPEFWYRPLAVAEPFDAGQARHFDLGVLAGEALTSHGPLEYDFLLIACGAVAKPAVTGALTFRGPADTDKMRTLLDELAGGDVHRVAFVVPWGAVWSLPLYELALMTGTYAQQRKLTHVELHFVTPEEEPLQLFGRTAGAEMRRLLDDRRIEFHAAASASALVDGELWLVPEGRLPADRVVALPRLTGTPLHGIPQTLHGFVPVDAHCEVRGVADVFAAGDITSFPVKQGGLATQQADAAAEAIAARLGAGVKPQPFRPVLRGLLLTGDEPRFLRHDVAEGAEAASPEPLWWPPGKIVGRYLAPFLARRSGAESPPEDAVAVEVEIDETVHALAAVPVGDDDDGPLVRDVMAPPPLVAAPEDTLGEIADRMRADDVGSVVVADFGRAIGILTSRDLMRAFAARVHPSEARAREWMTAEPVSVTPDTSVRAAVTLMTEHGVHRLPVLEGVRVVGMLGIRQAARVLQPAAPIGLGL